MRLTSRDGRQFGPGSIVGAALITLSLGSEVHAACASPVGQAGEFRYNATTSRYEVCDNAIWTSMVAGGAGAACTGAGLITYSGGPRFCNGSNYIPMAGSETGAACSTTGSMQYSSTLKHMQYCNGTNLIAMRNASASVAYVQQATLNYGNTAVKTFQSSAFSGSGNLGSGNGLVCEVWYDGGNTNSVVSAVVTGSQNLTRAIGPVNLAGGTAGFRTELWYGTGLNAASSARVTFTMTNNTVTVIMLCNEYSGLSSVSPIDQTTSTTVTGSTVTSAALSNSTAKSLLFGGASTDTGSPTAGSGYTMRGAVLNGCLVMDRTVTAASSYTASVTTQSSSVSGTLLFAILRSN